MPEWTPFAAPAKVALLRPLVLFVCEALWAVFDGRCWLVEVTGSDATTGDGILLCTVGDQEAHEPDLGIHATKIDRK